MASWGGFAKGLGKGLVSAGLWVSKHPEVIAYGLRAAGKPGLAEIVARAAAPAPPPTIWTPQLPPSPAVPQPAEPSPPQPVQLTLEQRFSDKLDAIYMEEWGRTIGKATSGDATERFQGYQLLADGREDELRKNLRERK